MTEPAKAKKPAAPLPEPQRSIEFMKDPMQWPGMVLPVKSIRGDWAVGVMLDERPRVYTISMFELSKYNGKKLDDLPHKDYPDLEGLTDEWRVD
jgi:hypothetical protein